jgi:hypothetical protein
MFSSENPISKNGNTQGKNKASRQESQNPFLKNYFEKIEEELTEKESESVSAFLQGIILDEHGDERDYNDIAKDIFYLESDPVMVRLQAKLEKNGLPRFRDYLITKVDVLLNRYSAIQRHSDSGVFPIPIQTDVVTVSEKKAVSIKKRDSKLELVVNSEHRPISKMNLESLLSKSVIGKLDPPTVGQFNYDYCIPESDGVRRPRQEGISKGSLRHVPIISSKEVWSTDLLINLPTSRINRGILPVPAGHIVVGSLDQALEIEDPGGNDPFCTRIRNEFEGDNIRYVVRRRERPLLADPKKFAPDDKECEELKNVLPLPKNQLQRAAVSFYGAKEAIVDHLSDQFLYMCDDRIGKFIENRPQELGTIMDGLRAGHCDLLAWTTAVYFRQLGYTAFVVNTEYTGENGSGFLRDSRHSRVAVIKETGGIVYIDPTQSCRAIDGYWLSGISDDEITQLEKSFYTAQDETEKKKVLQTFRRLIQERQTLVREEEIGFGKSVNRIHDADSMLDDIVVTDDDIEEYFRCANNFFSNSPSNKQKIEINKLCDVLAAKRVPLILDAVSGMRFVEKTMQLQEYARHLVESQGKPGGMQPGFSFELLWNEGQGRALFPSYVEAQYKLLSELEYGYLNTENEYNSTIISDGAVGSFPEKEKLMTFRESFVPFQPVVGAVYRSDELTEHVLFLKLVAMAMTDVEARSFLKKRFEIDDARLMAFAVQFEPMLSTSAKLKKRVSSVKEFSGKRTKEEYLAFCNRAKSISSQLTLNEAEYRMSSNEFLSQLSRIRLAPERAAHSWESGKDIFNIVESEYDPAVHDASMIDQEASERQGKLMVKAEGRTRKMTSSLFVHIDTGFLQPNEMSLMTYYAKVRVILGSLIKFSRLKNVTVSVSGGNNDYFVISPGTNPPLDVLIMRIIYFRIDRFDGKKTDYYGFRMKDGLPKNLLYISRSHGKINAVKYCLGKKLNVTAKSFSEMGLDVFSRLRLQESEDQENEEELRTAVGE